MDGFERIEYYRDLSGQIDKLFYSEKDDEGFVLINRALDESEKDNKAYNYFFIAEFESCKNKDFLKSIENIKKAAELIVNDYFLIRNMGGYLSNLKKENEAINKFKEALNLNSKDYDSLRNWGTSLYKLNNYKDAIEKFQEAFEINPNDYFSLIVWGVSLSKQNKEEEAIEKFKEALQKNPNDFNSLNLWGVSLSNQNKEEEAIEKFKEALQKNPNDFNSLRLWGISLSKQNKEEEAIEKFKEALQKNPNDNDSLRQWGVSLSDQNIEEEAIVKFKEALKIKPDDYASLRQWGFSLSKQRKEEEAIEKFKEALKIKPDDYDSLRQWGVSLSEQNKEGEAIEKFKEALKKNPDDYLSLRQWGVSLQYLEKHEEAIDKYKEALKIKPDDFKTYIRISLSYFKRKKYKEAFENIQEAKKIDKDNTQKFYDYFVKNNIHLLVKIENWNRKIRDKFLKLNDSVCNLVEELKVSKANKKEISHYTTLEVLNKIFPIKKDEKGNLIESKLRLSNVVHMNDPEEGKKIYNYFDYEDKDICKEDVIYLPIYLFSFVGSDVPDENPGDKLSFWRTYGKTKQNDADGVSITYDTDIFDNEEISPFAAMSERENINQRLVLYSVAYYENEKFFVNQQLQKGLQRKFIFIKKLFKEICELIDNEDEFAKADAKETLQIILSPLAYLVKSKHYMHENECRLILYYAAGDTRIKRENGRLYIETEKDLKIKQIILGPKLDKADEWGAYFKEYFSNEEVRKKHGDVVIKKSAVKFK